MKNDGPVSKFFKKLKEKVAKLNLKMDNTRRQNRSTGQAPPFEMPQTMNHQYQNDHDLRHDFNHSWLPHNLKNGSQRNCYQEQTLLQTKDTELNMFHENDSYWPTQLDSLQQKNLNQMNLEEANQKFKNEEIKRIKGKAKLRDPTKVELNLLVMIKESQKKLETHKVKVSTLEDKLKSLKKGNKSQVEQLKNKLTEASDQIFQLNLQLNDSSEMFRSSSDENKKLSAQVKQMEAEMNRRATYVSGLEEENVTLQKLIDETTSQTANELASECEQLKEELENEKKRSSELNETVHEQSERLNKLNTPCEEGKQELARKSNFESALHNMLGKAEDALDQAKTLVSREKSQDEELELKTNHAPEKNKELVMIIEGQEEEKNANSIAINQQQVLIASLKTQILQLEQNLKEKNKSMAIFAKFQEFLKDMDAEANCEGFVENLLDKIKQQDRVILTKKMVIKRLKGGKAKLKPKLQSEVSATSSSMVSQEKSCLSQTFSQENMEVAERSDNPDRSEIADDDKDSLRKRLRLA
ncbi:unnamed protein product [Orchesella dallaii]|uniref:Uncharacterized protein n=1 Tax=Orchesella dallaii TaxID=48710 RepID=A0ABP1R0G5_9HEXA